MRSLARLRPTPSMAVALAALFVALGGVGYAAATIDSGDIVNNSIRSKDIKNKGVANKDIKPKAVTGTHIFNNTINSEDVKTETLLSTDIKNGTINTLDVGDNALTGLDIDENTIGEVNSAENAGNAGNAATVSTVVTIPITTVAEGAAAGILASYGPFTIRGTCADAAGSTRAEVTIDTSENDTTVKGETAADTDLDAADPPAILSSVTDALVAPPTSSGYNEGVFNAFAPGTGKGAMTGHIASWANAAAPSQCKFHGSLVRSG